MTDKTVYATQDYSVRVTTIEEGDYSLEMYGIFNIDTGVREAEVRTLPGAITWTLGLQEKLDQAGDPAMEEFAVVASEETPIH